MCAALVSQITMANGCPSLLRLAKQLEKELCGYIIFNSLSYNIIHLRKIVGALKIYHKNKVTVMKNNFCILLFS